MSPIFRLHCHESQAVRGEPNIGEPQHRLSQRDGTATGLVEVAVSLPAAGAR